MIFKLTTKGCKVSDKLHKHINQHLAKITQALPYREDSIVFRLIIKKDIDKYFPPRSRAYAHKSYADTKPALAYYEGSITFRLDKKQLFAHFKGQTMDECVNTGFDRIFKELKKYKDLHFPAESEYPDHSSIRRG